MWVCERGYVLSRTLWGPLAKSPTASQDTPLENKPASLAYEHLQLGRNAKRVGRPCARIRTRQQEPKFIGIRGNAWTGWSSSPGVAVHRHVLRAWGNDLQLPGGSVTGGFDAEGRRAEVRVKVHTHTNFGIKTGVW